ncbi:helix-turn-helix domain-containing protein [Streptomyces sp. MAR4 CNX-425]|uniref:helix-turn-helix domain-containing protein n=1 Tax=Streptomyces sp. MAR4 CNX-425 TaxID=3406343 RepID=UPI003B506277
MSPEHAPLVEAMRELKERTGVSLAALAERTAYSKSSWERYLNGKSLPPRQAVRDICSVAGEPAGRLLGLWEIAEAHWRGRTAVGPPGAGERTPSPPEPSPPRPWGRGGRVMLALAAAWTLVAVGTTALVLLPLPVFGAAEDDPALASAPSPVPGCRGADCEGRDPMRLICGVGPETLSVHSTATGAHVELRHSEKCGASWARAWGTEIGDRLEMRVGGPAHGVRVRTRDDTETYIYTDMAAARPGSTVRACFRPAGHGARECVEARVGGPASPAG